MHAKAGFKQYQVLVHNNTFASRSDANESLEHEVVNMHNTLKSGHPVHKLQAITNLEAKSLSGKFVHVSSETLG